MVLNTLHTAETKIPKGVTVTTKARKVTVKGPHGVLKREFTHAVVEISLVGEADDRKVRVGCWGGSRTTRAVVQTLCSEIKNLIVGVTRGFRFEMRFVYAHFPINCNISADKKKIEIRNYIGSRNPLRTAMPHGVTIDRAEEKDTIVLQGIDLDHVSQAAASIQQKCQVKNKDIRKFLDGVYVSKREHIYEEDDE